LQLLAPFAYAPAPQLQGIHVRKRRHISIEQPCTAFGKSVSQHSSWNVSGPYGPCVEIRCEHRWHAAACLSQDGEAAKLADESSDIVLKVLFDRDSPSCGNDRDSVPPARPEAVSADAGASRDRAIVGAQEPVLVHLRNGDGVASGLNINAQSAGFGALQSQ
jgi:hypothetical protein